MISNLEELSWTEILGQIRVKYQKEFWEIIKILSQKIRRKLENLMSTCPTSNQGYTRTDLEDGELQKMLALPLYAYGRGENYFSSQRPIVSGTQEAKIIQKREASANRTQVDHSRRESLKSHSSQEPRASGKPDAIKERRTGKSVRKFYVQIC